MRRVGDATRLPGTKIQNRCVVTSTGVDAIDTLMGGGIPVSSVYVINEENSRKYSPILQKYFAAEGLSNGHCVFAYGPQLNVDEFASSLPGCSTAEKEQVKPEDVLNDNMQIAWRYKTMPAVASSVSAKDKKKFDLTTKMEVKPGSIQTFVISNYQRLWSHLCNLIKSSDFDVKDGKNVLRVLLTDIGSPLYEDHSNMRSFISHIKAISQTANVVIMMTVNDVILDEIESVLLMNAADARFDLVVPDAQTKKDMALEENYNGRFVIRKLPLLNSFATNKLDCVDYVFEKHRRYFDIRILHLPAVMGGAPPQSGCQRIQNEF